MNLFWTLFKYRFRFSSLWSLLLRLSIRVMLRLLLTRAKLYVEGSGAAATAAVLAGKIGAPRGARVAAIVSGGNVDPDRLLSAFRPGT